MKNERKEYLDKFRKIINFLSQHEELPLPLLPGMVYTGKDELITAAKFPGARKEYNESYFAVNVPVMKDVSLQFFTLRETVCTPTKYEDVEIPAQPARTERKVVEWDCHPLLRPSTDTKSEEAPFR